jgi:hypothetical protein
LIWKKILVKISATVPSHNSLGCKSSLPSQ